MEVLVCVKRVPATGGRITLTEDRQSIDTKFLGFTVSPHEECAVEEAVRLVEAHGGSSTALTLGPEVAGEQLRDAIAMGVDRAILLETGDEEWDAVATAAAILDAVRAEQETGRGFDVLLFGNEAADTGDYQVGIRVAHALGLPCVTGVKGLEVSEGTATSRRESGSGGWRDLRDRIAGRLHGQGGHQPAALPIRSGTHASQEEGDRACRAPRRPGELERVLLKLPPVQEGEVEILGEGPEAATAVVEILQTTRVGRPMILVWVDHSAGVPDTLSLEALTFARALAGIVRERPWRPSSSGATRSPTGWAPSAFRRCTRSGTSGSRASRRRPGPSAWSIAMGTSSAECRLGGRERPRQRGHGARRRQDRGWRSRRTAPMWSRATRTS